MFFYTTYEGGLWEPFKKSMRRQKALKELEKNKFTRELTKGDDREVGKNCIKPKTSGIGYFSRLFGINVHSVLFMNGRRWDAKNGLCCGTWRTPKEIKHGVPIW